MTEDARVTERVAKPVAEFWYGIQPQDHEIIRFREIHIDPYAVGDIWLVRGSHFTPPLCRSPSGQ